MYVFRKLNEKIRTTATDGDKVLKSLKLSREILLIDHQIIDWNRRKLNLIWDINRLTGISFKEIFQLASEDCVELFSDRYGGMNLMPLQFSYKLVDSKVEHINFRPGIHRVLKLNGIETISDILDFPKEDWKNIRNLGSKGLEEIEAKVQDFGFSKFKIPH